MYSNNDYRYYLERRMLASNDVLAHYAMVSYGGYLAHHGVVGMKWGQRKERYNSRIASNNAKIQQLTTKLNTVGAQKRKAKAAKYQAKVDKLQRKASKAQKRLAQGKSLSGGQQKKLMKYEQYKAKVAKNSYKNDKFQAKINKLQTKNARIQRRIERGDRRDLKARSKIKVNKGGGPSKVEYLKGGSGYVATRSAKDYQGYTMAGMTYGFGKTKKEANRNADKALYENLVKTSKYNKDVNFKDSKTMKKLRKKVSE